MASTTTIQLYFYCKHCNREFTRGHWRDEHQVKGKCMDKKFSCEKCSTRFTRKDALKNHIKKNICGQKIECKICNRKFKKWYHLEMHQKTPCNEEYTCFKCGVYKTFDRNDIFWHAKYCEESINDADKIR